MGNRMSAQLKSGLVDHPDDPGGIINMGISLRMPLLLVTLMVMELMSLILIGMKKSM
ncbi:MAG: hypothetical protein V7727_19130 [Sneathiella sp.]